MISPPARLERSPARILTTALLATLTTLVAPTAYGEAGMEGEGEDDWKLIEDHISSLATTDPDDKLDRAEGTISFLKPLLKGCLDHDEEDLSRVIDSLRHMLRAEKDDWITTRVLDDLLLSECEALGSLFLEALKDPSPNLIWYGVRWYADHDGPDAVAELRKVWGREERPWVRVDLIAALARQGTQEHLEDFIDLARGSTLDLSLAAIEALATLGDMRAIPGLARIAASGHEGARIAALAALAEWPHDRDALDAVLGASRRGEPAIRARAAASLASFSDSEAEDRLIELALSDSDEPWVRTAAIEGLDDLNPERVIHALIAILQEPAEEEDSYLHGRVISKLRDLDHPSILDALRSFAPQGDGFPLTEFAELKVYLGRDRAAHDGAVSFTLGCSFPFVITDPQDPRMIAVVPPPWMESIRCWHHPGVAGDPEELPRLPAGTPVRIDDHFELRGESWALVSSEEADDCWVPLRHIEHPTAPAVETRKEDTMRIRHEFDIPASEFESDVSRGLVDAGLLEVIEPGDGVLGVAIVVDAEDFEAIMMLARSCGLEETMLDDEIWKVVEKLAPLFPDNPALDRFRRAPRAAPQDVDTEVDLQLQEVSDQ